MIESMFGLGTLSVLVWLPILGGLLLLALGRSEGDGAGSAPRPAGWPSASPC